MGPSTEPKAKATELAGLAPAQAQSDANAVGYTPDSDHTPRKGKSPSIRSPPIQASPWPTMRPSHKSGELTSEVEANNNDDDYEAAEPNKASPKNSSPLVLSPVCRIWLC